MIPGTVASSLGLAIGGGDPTDLSDAYAFFDFVNGVYKIDGATVAIGDNIDKPGNVDPGNGLSIDWDVSGDVVEPTGDLLAALCRADFTLVVEAFMHADAAGSTLNWINARLSSDPADFYWLLNSFNTGASFDSDNVNGLGGPRFITPNATAVPPATRRVAMTRALDRIAGSTNGGAVETDTTGGWLTVSTMDTAIIGAQVGDTDPFFKGFIRLIAVVPIRDDADLPAISSL
jgi:hypothetical protein